MNSPNKQNISRASLLKLIVILQYDKDYEMSKYYLPTSQNLLHFSYPHSLVCRFLLNSPPISFYYSWFVSLNGIFSYHFSFLQFFPPLTPCFIRSSFSITLSLLFNLLPSFPPQPFLLLFLFLLFLTNLFLPSPVFSTSIFSLSSNYPFFSISSPRPLSLFLLPLPL